MDTTKVRKVKKVRLVSKSLLYRGGLFDVMFEGQDAPVCMRRSELDLVWQEQEMLENGIPEDVILKQRRSLVKDPAPEDMLNKHRELIQVYLDDQQLDCVSD